MSSSIIQVLKPCLSKTFQPTGWDTWSFKCSLLMAYDVERRQNYRDQILTWSASGWERTSKGSLQCQVWRQGGWGRYRNCGLISAGSTHQKEKYQAWKPSYKNMNKFLTGLRLLQKHIISYRRGSPLWQFPWAGHWCSLDQQQLCQSEPNHSAISHWGRVASNNEHGFQRWISDFVVTF